MKGDFWGRLKSTNLIFYSSGSVFSSFFEKRNIQLVFTGIITNSVCPLHNKNSNEILEFILGAYLKYGAKLSSFLLGQYSLLIHDINKNKLILIQDSFGTRPIYYSYIKENEIFHFSSLLDKFENQTDRNSLNLSYFVSYISSGGIVQTSTPFKNIRKLAFGSTLIFQNQLIKVLKPWSPSQKLIDTSNPELRYNLVNRLEEGFRFLKGTRSNIACQVSGGLDSSTNYYILKNQGFEVMPISVINPEFKDGGDTQTIKTISLHNNLNWNYIEDSEYPFFKKIAPFKLREPGGETGFALRRKMHSLLKNSNIDILISGQGGDQVFGSTECQPYGLADDLYNGRFYRLISEAKEYAKNSLEDRSLTYWIFNYSIKVLIRHFLKKPIGSLYIKNNSPSWLKNDIKITGEEKFQNSFHYLPGRNALWNDIYLISHAEAYSPVNFFPCFIYYPLLHRPLVEFMLKLPYCLRNSYKMDRVLQRIALEKILPKIILNRSNKGSAQYSFDSSFSNNNELQSRLKSSKAVELGLFKEKNWFQTLDRANFGLYENLPQFFASVSTELWLQGFFQKSNSKI